MEKLADSLSVRSPVDVIDSNTNDSKIKNQEELELKELKVRSSSTNTISDATVNNRATEQRTSPVLSLLSVNYINKISTAFKLCCLILLVVAVNQVSIILYFTDQSNSNIVKINGIVDFKSCSVSCDSYAYVLSQ